MKNSKVKLKIYPVKLNFYFTGIILILIIFFSFFGVVKSLEATNYYMSESGNDDCTNLNDCFDLMSGGDNLIIRDGVYTGADNMITEANYLPNGNETDYTTIRAENNGGVFFDGEYSRQMFDFEL